MYDLQCQRKNCIHNDTFLYQFKHPMLGQIYVKHLYVSVTCIDLQYKSTSSLSS